MLLTSLKRIKDLFSILPENEDEDLSIARMNSAVSRRIEHYLKRELKLKTYTEHFNPTMDQKVFRTKAYPISSITSIKIDSSGLYSGNETTISSSNYIISADGRTVILNTVPNYSSTGYIHLGYSKSLRIIYVGGVSADPTISEWTLSSLSAAVAVGNVVSGNTSGARGRVTYTLVNDLKVENDFGLFEEGESLSIGDETAVLASIDSTCLAEIYPDIVLATEIQVRYMHKHKSDFENATTERDLVSRRGTSADLSSSYTFLPEVRDLIEPYRNKIIDGYLDN